MPDHTADHPVSSSPRNQLLLRFLGWGCLYTLLLLVGTWFAFWIRPDGENIVVIWAPTGLTLGALLLMPRKWWLPLIVVSAAVYIGYVKITGVMGQSLWEAVFHAGVGTVVMWVGAEAFWWGNGRKVKLETPRDLGWLFGVIFVTTGLGALVSNSLRRMVDPGIDYWHEWQMWWFSDALGALIVIPWMLSWFRPSREDRRSSGRGGWGEMGLILLGMILVCLVLVGLPDGPWSVIKLRYLIFPLMVWLALRYALRWVTTGLLIMAVLFTTQVAKEMGPFAMQQGDFDSYQASTLALQAYLLIVCFSVLVFSVVVSQSRAAQSAIRASHERLSVLTGTLRPTLWLMDLPEEKLTYVSQGFEKLSGRPRESMLGKVGAWREMVHPEDVPLTAASLERMKDRGWDDTQYRIVLPDGNVRWVREQSAAVIDDTGAMVQLAGSVEDVTHRHVSAQQQRQLQVELRESLERYQNFLRITSEGVWRAEFDPPVPVSLPFPEFLTLGGERGKLAECSNAFAVMYGFDTPGDAVGTPLGQLFKTRDEFNQEYLARFHASGCRSMVNESRRIESDGTVRWFLATFAGVVVDGSIQEIWGTLTDITELRELNDQLRESQKMEAVGQLAGGVAHDFNNLLTVIAAHAELVEGQVGDEESVARSLGVVREAIEHAAGVSRSLMAFSKNLPADRKPTDLEEVILQTRRLVSRTLRSSIKLMVDVPEDGLKPVMGDAVQLQQVLLNLTLNARDAMPEAGGTIRIAAENFERRDVVGRPTGAWVRVSVADDGKGMSERVRQRVFDPFFSTKETDGGTGLGLSVVRGIIEEHGGTIAVFSRHEQGTTFTIELPCADNEPAAAEAPPTQVEHQPMELPIRLGQTVLLSEDDRQIRAAIVTVLMAQGYDVVQAADGLEMRQAYDEYRQKNTEFAVIVTDIDMPGRTGLDVLRELRQEGDLTPAIMITGSVDLKIAPELKGNTVLINKPFNISKLCGVIHEQIQHRRGSANGGGPVNQPEGSSNRLED